LNEGTINEEQEDSEEESDDFKDFKLKYIGQQEPIPENQCETEMTIDVRSKDNKERSAPQKILNMQELDDYLLNNDDPQQK